MRHESTPPEKGSSQAQTLVIEVQKISDEEKESAEQKPNRDENFAKEVGRRYLATDS